MNTIRSIRRAMYVLGIETSCDDTAVAIVSSTGKVLAEVVSSQWALLEQWKGIVPALAARSHQQNLPLVLQTALEQSGLKSFKELDAVAVTSGPGLAPCLNVGLSTAIDLAQTHQLDFLAINHLEAHALVPRLLHKDIQFPFLVLLVSGGHCSLVLAKDVGNYDVLGSTVDDSVGEAFDKVARMLELTSENNKLHGGALVEAYALNGNPRAFPLTEPMKKKKRKDCDFSFAGLKTNMMRLIAENEPLDDVKRQDFAASFQRTAIAHLVTRTKLACELSTTSFPEIKHLIVCGGVAANSKLRDQMTEVAKSFQLEAVFPPPRYCTDNGVMVAWAGMERYLRGVRDDPSTTKYTPRWPLNTLSTINATEDKRIG
ncbi:O-sialoglycoprotein endopeptidase [Thraustotheca clavata]|uniref:N(6)-L-threonylcarbamoyladenine synthase n=1 Tax=Thraustotheca clavata TaxID=74557 RepID=A0A1V9ZHK4_9STRA|nr:O-sialoglycoprotein endopeptidase [Thraustotheca clavata]